MHLEFRPGWPPPPPPRVPRPDEYRAYCLCGHSGYSHGERGCCACTCENWQRDASRPPDPH